MKNFFKYLFLLGIIVFAPFVFVGCNDDLVLVTKVELYKDCCYVSIDESFDLDYKVFPSNASNKKVNFWSTDENVASVDANGKVTVKDYGEASIIIRSVDGGYEDYCRVISEEEPTLVKFDELNGKVKSVTGKTYAFETTVALNQVLELKLNYFIDGNQILEPSNKTAIFSSSNTNNIKVINETEGVIEAVYDGLVDDEQAYSDITATYTTSKGEIKSTCRVYINRDSNLKNLQMFYKSNNEKVLKDKDGSDKIYLTTSGDSVSFYAYLTDNAKSVKTDYEMALVSSDTELFTVNNTTTTNGVYEFSLVPSNLNAGTSALQIITTCSDESGITIKTSVSVVVEAQVNRVTPSATNRKMKYTEVLMKDTEEYTEVLLPGEIFSINLSYFDQSNNKIIGAEREIFFEELPNCVTKYGNNTFKIQEPTTSTQTEIQQTGIQQITGYVYENREESGNKVTFTYTFLVRNDLESIIVSTEPKNGSQIPQKGIKEITITQGEIETLYVYATDYANNQSVSVLAYENLYINTDVGEDGTCEICGEFSGTTTLVFYATDNIKTIEYELVVHIVKGEYEIQTEEIGGKTYVSIISVNGYPIECPSSITLTLTDGFSLVEEIVDGVVKRYITGLSGTHNVDIFCEEYNIKTTISVTI